MDQNTLNKKLEIETQIELMRAENKRVPDVISETEWKALLTECRSFKAREKFLNYLFKKEKARLNERQKKIMKRQEKLERQEEEEEHEWFAQHSVHIPHRDKEDKWWKGLQSVRSDIPVIYDLDFDCSRRELTNAFDQFRYILRDNARHVQPLQIHFTSIDKNERLSLLLETTRTFGEAHKEHFLDVFPPEDLLYLSPSGPPLTNFDTSCTYVVGGLVDTNPRPRLTYGLARRYGIKCASFPIKHYCEMVSGSTTVLTLNCVHSILMDMYIHQSWKQAFKTHLPRGFFLRGDKEAMMEKMKLEDLLVKRRFERVMEV